MVKKSEAAPSSPTSAAAHERAPIPAITAAAPSHPSLEEAFVRARIPELERAATQLVTELEAALAEEATAAAAAVRSKQPEPLPRRSIALKRQQKVIATQLDELHARQQQLEALRSGEWRNGDVSRIQAELQQLFEKHSAEERLLADTLTRQRSEAFAALDKDEEPRSEKQTTAETNEIRLRIANLVLQTEDAHAKLKLAKGIETLWAERLPAVLERRDRRDYLYAAALALQALSIRLAHRVLAKPLVGEIPRQLNAVFPRLTIDLPQVAPYEGGPLHLLAREMNLAGVPRSTVIEATRCDPAVEAINLQLWTMDPADSARPATMGIRVIAEDLARRIEAMLEDTMPALTKPPSAAA